MTRAHSGWALDDVAVVTEVTKFDPDDVKDGPAEGVYVHGLYLDGCGWSKKESKLVEAPAKVLYIPLPCMLVTAVQTSMKKLEYLFEEEWERSGSNTRGSELRKPYSSCQIFSP